MMGKTYLSLIQYRRPESGSNLLDADMAKELTILVLGTQYE